MNNLPENCLDCTYHEVVDDSFEKTQDGNKAVLCLLTTAEYNPTAEYAADKWPHDCVTIGCKHENLRNETEYPGWCPLRIK